ncbi:MAG: T9SS type A sorting domain-containing protein [Marinilabiliaceae bacterium]|nr:T9SS type A sorting domain-containing protein [Marinilabiliaceae bacterium]
MQKSINLSKIKKSILLFGASITLLTTSSFATTGTWESSVTGNTIMYTTTESPTPAKDANGKFATVVYLENMSYDKIGTNSNTDDVNWLLSNGYRVIELNYNKHDSAKSPNINSDIILINDAIASGSFCGLTDCSTNQSYVLFEGYRIKRNVPYYIDDPSVYGYGSQNDSLYMDIIYPANSNERVPVVLSFSYSNSDQNNPHSRLFLGYTLAMFDDSFLEGAPARNIAWAIADHPKYAPWGYGDTKSFEVNPDAARKVKSAVRTLRVLSDTLGLSGKIGIYGFSRGSDAGSMAVGDKADATIDQYGFNIGVSSAVQAAALGSGVFDFTQIYNTIDDGDKNLENLCPELWGDLATNYEKWFSMGAVYFVETSASAPVLFFYNTDDSPYYIDQIAHFKTKLDTTGISVDSLINYDSGHKVPKTEDALNKLYNFFNEKFALSTEIKQHNTDKPNNNSLTIYPNPANRETQVSFSLTQANKVQITLRNQLNVVIFQTDKQYQAGLNNTTINLDKLQLPEGIYFLTINVNNKSSIQKLLKKN